MDAEQNACPFAPHQKGHDFVEDGFERSRFKSVVGFVFVKVGKPTDSQIISSVWPRSQQPNLSPALSAPSKTAFHPSRPHPSCFTVTNTISPSDLSEILIPNPQQKPQSIPCVRPSPEPHHKTSHKQFQNLINLVFVTPQTRHSRPSWPVKNRSCS